MRFHNVGRFKTHPGIHFANITVLQLHVSIKIQPLVDDFANVFKFLDIQDLSLDCGGVSSFMVTVMQVWAPVLQNLTILRIVFNRFAEVSGYIY